MESHTSAHEQELADRLTYTVGDGEPQDVLGALAALLVELHLAADSQTEASDGRSG
jgi:hypothetical protein